jgi:hypothetical protein
LFWIVVTKKNKIKIRSEVKWSAVKASEMKESERESIK